EPLHGPRDAVLLHRLDANDFHAVLILEREILRSVQRAANAGLDHAARIHGSLLDGATERRAVEELRAEVLVPRVGMRIEMDDADGPVPARDRAQDRQRDRMVAAHT